MNTSSGIIVLYLTILVTGFFRITSTTTTEKNPLAVAAEIIPSTLSSSSASSTDANDEDRNLLNSKIDFPIPKNLSVDFDDLYNEHNCSNDYCMSDTDYIDLIIDHITPKPLEWVLIVMHGLTFVIGLIGNALVCTAVYRNRAMRNVTNYFIVNLAVADFMVILFCLPPTVLWDVTETWFLGSTLCKIILYFQTVSVAVSVLTLTFISVDRWYAICFPLKFKSTTARAKMSIVFIWITSLVIDIPELVVLDTFQRKDFPVQVPYFTQCEATWSEREETIYQILKMILLYTVPLLFMSIAYCQIVRVLWTSDNIPGHTETLKMMSSTGYAQTNLNGNRRMTFSNTTDSQLRSRRKAAKMLVAVVFMFAVCYFPVHLLNMLRSFVSIDQTEFTAVWSNLSHWLCYANSAINPIIYNFMSGKFRREFKRAFHQCHKCGRRNKRSDIDMLSQNDFGRSSHRRTSHSCQYHSSRRTKTTSFISHA